MKTNMKYEEAMQELELIVNEMETDKLDMDVLLTKLKRAQTLVKLCRNKLTKTDAEIKSILKQEELQEGLE